MKIFNLADEEIVINFDLGYSNLELAILVAVMSFFVGIFSFFYITKYRGYFFFWLAVFSLSMIGFTLSDNLVLTFVFWEGLGFSSYFLVRFYGTLESESRAKYVFLFNRVGDLGFLILIAGSFFYLDTLSLTKIVNAVKSDISGHDFDLLGAGLLLCAFGKSAQGFFYPWLRFAMAGPTPVSSLLHSATMVGAGSILVWKLTPLLNGWQLDFIYWTVILTALISSLSAITCRDAKEMLAYSTISNLGLLFLCAILSREFFIPMFTAHAFFKCGAFLYVGLKSQGLSTTKFTDLAKQPLQLSDSISLFILAISLSSVSPLGVGLFKQTLSTNSDLVFLISFLSAIYGYRFLRELYSKPSFEIDLSIQSLVVVTLAILALVYPLSFGEINFNLLKSLMIFLLAILTHELLTKRISYDPAYQIEKFVLWIIRVITGIFKSIVHVFDVSLNMLIGSLQDTAKILGFAYSNLIYVRFEVVFAILLVLSLTIVYLGG